MTADFAERYAHQLDAVQRIAEHEARHCCCWHPDLMEMTPGPLCGYHQILEILERPEQP